MMKAKYIQPSDKLVKKWRLLLADSVGEENASEIITRFGLRYEALNPVIRSSKNPFIRSHMKNSILPILALYQAMREQEGSKEKILTEMRPLIEETYLFIAKPSYWITPWFMPLFGYLPKGFDIFRSFAPLMQRVLMPFPGFEIEYSKNTSDSYEFKVHKCLYHEMFSTYAAPELTVLACMVDNIIFKNHMPRSIRWTRDKQLSYGDEFCFFQFKKV